MSLFERRTAVCAILAFVASCRSSPPPPAGEPAVTVETILGQSAAHIGKTVTINAAVSRPFGERGFTVSSMGGLGDLLIYKGGSGQGSIPPVSANDLVRVQGIVREYQPQLMRQQEGDDFANDLAGYTGKVIVEATHVQMLPR